MAPHIDSRIQSPRPETPEPSSRQGRRNPQLDAQLLDADGAVSVKVCPTHNPNYAMVFMAYASSNAVSVTSSPSIARHAQRVPENTTL
jgi:hypothetical protein